MEERRGRGMKLDERKKSLRRGREERKGDVNGGG